MAITTKGKINIAVIGAVSAGKTTLVNGLFVRKFGDMKMKRTTALPQLYHATGGKIDKAGAAAIYAQNAARNKEIMDKTVASDEAASDDDTGDDDASDDDTGDKSGLTLEDIKGIDYVVDPIPEVFPLHEGVFAVVHDLPGLNDSRTKKVYMKYINENFHRYAVIFFVIGIDSALNTSDEMDILNMILTNIAACATKGMLITLLVLINKCDEMTLSETERDGHDGLDVSGEELEDQVKQIHTIVEERRKHHGVSETHIAFVKIASEEIFLYRMCAADRFDELDDKHVSKFGQNEMGKHKWAVFKTPEKRIDALRKIMEKRKQSGDEHDSLKLCGFVAIRAAFVKCLNKASQRQYLINEIMWDMYSIKDFGKADIAAEIKQFAHIRSRVDEVGKTFGTKIVRGGKTYNKIDAYVAEFKKNYTEHNAATFDAKHTLQSIEADIYHIMITVYDSFRGLMFESRGITAPTDAQNEEKIRANISLYYTYVFAAVATKHEEFLETLRLAMDGGYIEGDLRREMDEKIMSNLYNKAGSRLAEDIGELIKTYCGFTRQPETKFLWANAVHEMAREYAHFGITGSACDDTTDMRRRLLTLRRLAETTVPTPGNDKYLRAICEYEKIFLSGGEDNGLHVCVDCIADKMCAGISELDVGCEWPMTALFITHITAA